MAREKKTQAKAEPKKKSVKAEPKAEAKPKRAAKPKEKAEPKRAVAKAEVKERHDGRFAVIQAQGVQLRVGRDEEHILPHLGGETGDQLKIDRVLLVSDGSDISVGTPLVEGAVVTLQVVGHERGEKIRVGTYKRRKKYRRKIGYRDTLTRVKVLDISLPGGEKRGKHGS